MKKHATPRFGSASSSGFSLMELLVVIAVMAALAAMVAGTAGYVQRKSRVSKAEGQMQAMALGLERYKSDYGGYPVPTGISTKSFGDTEYDVGGARMLYQALSGDGSDAIAGVGGNGSNGILGETEDGTVYLDILAQPGGTQGIVKEDSGQDYYLIDPFGHPWQYEAYDRDNPNETHNMTYDLWSYGLWDPASPDEQYQNESDPRAEAKWIKNW